MSIIDNPSGFSTDPRVPLAASGKTPKHMLEHMVGQLDLQIRAICYSRVPGLVVLVLSSVIPDGASRPI